ncbi:hypothetical protein CHLNCDRAFT_53751 [Chlorella variabilis]|uniref:Uncharacterized protein n=1 Tax=Chlorella variabilis TaxID=554065 RepID=E1ZL02_CHLVA|nr:hypothetical protein CHLNCDRAFT_53751 [Chlorella variabilis]EFN53475.1 hypothetical protein CHLNCDRAFT_53751 [Chlorella variabilis]|eukprot:XP_005845577.1 hypothetical protein CHLNCDRAFT_53751 [Chlorella variabilis]
MKISAGCLNIRGRALIDSIVRKSKICGLGIGNWEAALYSILWSRLERAGRPRAVAKAPERAPEARLLVAAAGLWPACNGLLTRLLMGSIEQWMKEALQMSAEQDQQEIARLRHDLLTCQARVREQDRQLRNRDAELAALEQVYKQQQQQQQVYQQQQQQLRQHHDDLVQLLQQHNDDLVKQLRHQKRKRDEDEAAAATKEELELLNRVQDLQRQLAACRAELAQRRLSGAGSGANPHQQQEHAAGDGAAAQPAAEGGGGHAQASREATVGAAATLVDMPNAPDGAPVAPIPQEPPHQRPASSRDLSLE